MGSAMGEAKRRRDAETWRGEMVRLEDKTIARYKSVPGNAGEIT
jgi:hypothetical protein